MRITLVIAGLGGGGAERVCINLANAWATRGKHATILTISQNKRAPAYAIEPLDTTGAGDSFNAGFLHVWLADGSSLDALRLGAACGALSTRGLGGTAGQADLAEAQAVVAGAARPAPPA